MTASSFSRSQGANLPGAQPSAEANSPSVRQAFDQNRDPSIAAQTADQIKTEAQRRQSFMVKRDRPHPVQRPSPSLALGADSAAFNARWEKERNAADANRDALKAQFKAKRLEQFNARSITRERAP